jgi:uncharacterized protein YebE (UPF0316 family)
MSVQPRRKNLLFGLVALATSVLWLLRAFAVFPAYLDDLIVRAAPIVLVIVGLSLLLKNRIPLSDIVAVIIAGGLVFGIGTTAFNIRENQSRTENIITVEHELDDDIILLRIRLQSLNTDVEIARGPTGQDREVRVVYEGSTERELFENFSQDDATSATLTVNELRRNPVPMLEAVGRGSMLVELPREIPVDVQLESIDGQVLLNMSGVRLERLNLNQAAGEALVTLPRYQPIFSRPEDALGTLALDSGPMTLRVPEEVSARFDMSDSSGGEPEYDPEIYNLLFNRDVLEARNIDNAEIVHRYSLIVSRNQLTVDIPGSDGS